MKVNNLQEQLEFAVSQHRNSIGVLFSDGLLHEIVEHIKTKHDLNDVTQSELDDFVKGYAIEEAVSYFLDNSNED